MDKIKIKETIRISNKKGINYLLDKNNKLVKNKPWLGDIFSFFYDRIMEKSVFPKKFNASIDLHYKILGEIFKKISDKTMIEFAAGSGDATRFLNSNNVYAGVDISSGLLRIAKKKFELHGFTKFELYCADACDTPFQDNSFDAAICNLSLNFFQHIENFISETHRVLKANGILYCCVPIPEKKNPKATIRGKLYKLDELREKFESKKFKFEPLPFENGALIYFKAETKS